MPNFDHLCTRAWRDCNLAGISDSVIDTYVCINGYRLYAFYLAWVESLGTAPPAYMLPTYAAPRPRLGILSRLALAYLNFTDTEHPQSRKE